MIEERGVVDMNEVFMKDRMARDNADYEGSGVGSTKALSEEEIRKNKFDDIKLPLLLLLGMVLVFLLTLWLHSGELIVRFSGTAVTVPYRQGDSTVRFPAPDGRVYIIDVSWSRCKKDVITLYYTGEDYRGAIAMTVWWLFAASYFVCLLVGGLMVWNIYKVYHNSGHATQSRGSGKFED